MAVTIPAEDEARLAGIFGGWTVRDHVVGAVDTMVKVGWWHIGCKPIRTLALLLEYADQHPGRGSKRVPMDNDAMVSKWVESIVGLSTGHSHAAHTAADHETDEMLLPMLSAPIAQIRTFAVKLGEALERDERVPFMVWSGYRRIVEPLILKSQDGEVLELKKQLASEIAEMTERGLDRAELVQAIAGALQWRNPNSLARVKGALEAGEKPKIKGRESCLFLEVGGEMVVL
jgi:hypothetical protein